jgi:hypothetical protein
MKVAMITVIMFALCGAVNAIELTKEEKAKMAVSLALQYAYMETCKDFPPLPPDRLRTIDTMTEMLNDPEAIKKAAIVLSMRLNLSDKDKATAFCERMAGMIKNEPGHEK